MQTTDTNQQNSIDEAPLQLADFAGTTPHDYLLQNQWTDTPQPQVLEVVDYSAEAQAIWARGEAFDYIRESCSHDHVGDKTAIAILILSYACTRVINSTGAHVSISGKAGAGKSHVAKTVASRLPRDAVVQSRLSDKALMFHPIPPKTVLILDDQELSEDMQELLKISTTNWDKPSTYLTVCNQKPQELHMAERCPYWIVKSNLNGDEQTLDRMFVIWIDDSDEQKLAIQRRTLEYAINPTALHVDESINICHDLWDCIPTAVIRIPYAERIRMDKDMDPRNINLMLSIIQAIALLHAPARESEPATKERPMVIYADESDFETAAKLINPLLENVGGSQRCKLSKTASEVLDYLRQHTEPFDVSLGELQQATGKNAAEISRALHGRNDNDCDGLLAVCPAVSEIRMSVVQNSGKTRTVKGVSWSPEAYVRWMGSAGMFTLARTIENLRREQK